MGRGTAVLAAAMMLALSGCSTTTVPTSAGAPGQSTTSAPSPTATAAAAPKVLYEKSGKGDYTTPKFQAPAEWSLQWSYDCSDYPLGSGNFIVEAPGLAGPDVNELGKSGSDTTYVHDGAGLGYLTILSECSWSIKAVG